MRAILNPYISFGGKTREAMEFYQSVFGGELSLTTFAEHNMPEAPAEGIMHAQLDVDGSPLIMGSDGTDSGTMQGFSLALGGNAGDELREYFTKLGEDGQVTKDLEKESWGAEFGMVVDKFGIQWMVNIQPPKS